MNSTISNIIIDAIKETKIIGEFFPPLVPYNRSDRRSSILASQKTLKYIIPINANMTDIQNGRKSIENKSIKKAEIRSIIASYYTLYFKIQTRY